MQDEFDLGKTLKPKVTVEVEATPDSPDVLRVESPMGEIDVNMNQPVTPSVKVGAGPIEIRSVPLTSSQSRALMDAQKARIMEFDHQVVTLGEQAKGIVVRDQESNETAVKIGALATKLAKDIDGRVHEIIAPANEFVKEVRNFGKSYIEKLTDTKAEIGKKTANWRALKEMERLKAQALADRAAKDVQKEINAQAGQLGIEPPKIEPAVVKKEPVITRTEYGSAYTRVYKKFRIINPMILERQYLMPDDKAIQEAIEAGIEVKGVEVYEESKTVFRT